MGHVKLTINGQEVEVSTQTTILEAAKTAGIYIPTLCYHPDLPAAKGSQAAKVVYQGEKRIENAAWFEFEEDKMYSKRESELIQQYLQEHGEMPGGGDSDLDDLF